MSTMPEKNEGKKKTSSASPKVKVSSKLSIVQDVIRLMDDAGVSELSFEQKGIKVHVRKGPGMPFNTMMAPAAPMAPMMAAPVAVSSSAPAPAAAAPAAAPAEQGTTLKSPMVGTYYRAASPDAKPFIEEGAKI